MPAKKKKLRIAVIYGGKSGEHDVSVMSARAVIGQLDPNAYAIDAVAIGKDGVWRRVALIEDDGGRAALPTNDSSTAATVLALPAIPDELGAVDVAFPLVHGTYGEDGALQGLLEMAGVPYVGSGVLGSAVGMDKDVQKRLLLQAGLQVAPFITLVFGASPGQAAKTVRRIERELRYPMFVKPANLGSSVGITKAHHRAELAAGIAEAFRYDRKIVVEQGIEGAREIECGVLGGAAARASVPGEIIPSNEFYDYEAKYVSGASREIIPAKLPSGMTTKIRAMAVRVFETLGAYGMARVDFFLDPKARAIVVNEINTVPGFTEHSMFAKLWAATGVPFPKLLDELVHLAIARAAAERRLIRAYEPSQHG